MPKYSTFAILSLIFGFLSLIPFLGFITMIPAIVLGILGIRDCNKQNLNGKGLAIVGLVFGCVVLFLTSIVVFTLNGSNEVSDSLDESSVVVDNSASQTEDEEEIIYSIDENIPVDYLTYKVTNVETFTEMGSTFLKEETNGKFIKVYIEITNNALETKQLFSPRFTIVDSLDRSYDEFSGYGLYISDGFDFGQQLQPGLSESGAVVFEMPKDSEELTLVINGDWLSMTEVKISLDQINDVRIDTTLEDEQDAMIEESMNKCSAPFKCFSSCDEYMDVGQKDCSAGEVCCMS